ncbi:MAG: hypothetical protein L0Z53_01765 [Acidobacteriales bacterium]|nr:hypothetical protein [Terriglobales bacterium]
MKNRIWFGLGALALALVLAGVSSAQKETTVEGTLVDSACYLKDNSLTGNDHGPMKDCGTMCLKGGTPAGVLTKGKKFHAVIAPSTALADYVGQTVRVSGSLHNQSILAKKVEVNKNGKWEEVKLGAMM